jgi:hypothetical protein
MSDRVSVVCGECNTPVERTKETVRLAIKSGRPLHCDDCLRNRNARQPASADGKLWRCNTCNENKPRFAFGVSKATKTGILSKCKKCRNEEKAEHRLGKAPGSHALMKQLFAPAAKVRPRDFAATNSEGKAVAHFTTELARDEWAKKNGYS